MKKIIILFCMLFAIPLVIAGYCAKIEVADISPSSIGIDEEFTVGLQIENCGTTSPKYVALEITNPPPEIIIKEPLKIDIGRLTYQNSKRLVLYHMRTTKNAVPGNYVIYTRLIYGDEQLSFKDSNITITVMADEAKLNVASAKTFPTLPHKGDTVELTLRIENFGDGIANSIKVIAEHPFQGSRESFIGTLDSDEDGPALFTFIADKPGEFQIPIKIIYKDDYGEHEKETNVNIIILEKETNWLGIILITILILAIILFIFYHFRTKRKKDNIIKQLLIENNNNKKQKKK